MPNNFEITLYREEETLEVEVEFNFTAAERSRTYGPPEDCYEGYPAEVEILSVRALDGAEVILTDGEIELIEEGILALHEELKGQRDFDDYPDWEARWNQV